MLTADLHLGLQLSYLDLSSDDNYSFDFIIDIAIKQHVDFLIIAGDIFDKINPSNDLLQYFILKMRILNENNILPILISGNHDTPRSNRAVVCKIVEKAGLGIVLDNKHKFTEKIIKIKNYNVSFLGKTFNHKIRSLKENLEIHRRQKDIDLRIGLYHGDIDNGFYEPVSTEAFTKSDIDIWVIGHKHNAKIIKTDNNIIIIPGTIEKLSFSQENYEPGVFIAKWTKQNKNPILKFIKTPSRKLKSIFVKNLSPETQNIDEVILNKLADYKERNQNKDSTDIFCRLVLEGKISRKQFHTIEFSKILNNNKLFFKKFLIDTSNLLIEDTPGIFTQGNFDLTTVFQMQIHHKIASTKIDSERKLYRTVLSKGLSLLNKY